MAYEFTEKQKNTIIEKWGNDFYDKIVQTIKIYSKKWKLSDFELMEYYSVNAIVFCKSETYGDCVLKIGGNWQDYEFVGEYNTLREYNGRKYVKVYEGDIDIANGKKVTLMERVKPGTRLSEEPYFEKRLAVFSELYNGLHIEPENPEIYDYFTDWVDEAVKNCEESQNDLKEIDEYMQKAKDIYLEIIKTYDKNMLLHIDIYGANVVSDSSGGYKIIDPKGVIGDPIFETGQFIFNECCEDKIEPEKAGIIFDYLDKSLNIPQDILRKCFFIETVRFISYYAAKYGASEFDVERIKFAESVMNNGINHKGTQTIETERLILRKILPDDAEIMFKWMSDPEVLRYEDWDPHQTADYTRGYISYITGDYKSDETYLWGIQLGDELIGHILGGNVLAYYLRKDCWSKGYATEAVRAVIKYMFTEVGIDRIEAKHSVKNVVSGKVLKKAGMIFEKHEKAVYHCDSEWQDCDFYYLTKNDFIGFENG